MPILRLKDARSMASEDRRKRLDEFRTELSRLRTMIKAGGAVENSARIRELRKAIARLLTVESEAKRAELKERKKP
ncbi:MAG TPA: 50S ribosomal protein L29 [Candidatus Krumholzibacteriaceae bacterium]|jgi:large subunit ribosomal protein L29|nr:50S ribosomal protein L29 [Candidatus Krumholzibacteriaceae bacterium]